MLERLLLLLSSSLLFSTFFVAIVFKSCGTECYEFTLCVCAPVTQFARFVCKCWVNCIKEKLNEFYYPIFHVSLSLFLHHSLSRTQSVSLYTTINEKSTRSEILTNVIRMQRKRGRKNSNKNSLFLHKKHISLYIYIITRVIMEMLTQLKPNVYFCWY